MPNPVAAGKYVVGVVLFGTLAKVCLDYKPQTKEELLIKMIACFAGSTIFWGQGCSETAAYRRGQFPGQYDNIEMANKNVNPHRARGRGIKQPGQNAPNLRQGSRDARPATPAFISIGDNS